MARTATRIEIKYGIPRAKCITSSDAMNLEVDVNRFMHEVDGRRFTHFEMPRGDTAFFIYEDPI